VFILKKFGRKDTPPVIHTSSLLPDAIDVIATEMKRNSVIAVTPEEFEEGEWLRDAAAQSISLDPSLMIRSPTSPLGHLDFGFNDDHCESIYDDDADADNPTSKSPSSQRKGAGVP
jgi:hypothetical protein